jgi:hypothetical protein
MMQEIQVIKAAFILATVDSKHETTLLLFQQHI